MNFESSTPYSFLTFSKTSLVRMIEPASRFLPASGITGDKNDGIQALFPGISWNPEDISINSLWGSYNSLILLSVRFEFANSYILFKRLSGIAFISCPFRKSSCFSYEFRRSYKRKKSIGNNNSISVSS